MLALPFILPLISMMDRAEWDFRASASISPGSVINAKNQGKYARCRVAPGTCAVSVERMYDTWILRHSPPKLSASVF
jgi:hypothetical protein